MQEIDDGIVEKWSAMGIQSEPVILVSKQNLNPVTPVVRISIKAIITASGTLRSPSSRRRTGAAIYQIAKSIEEKT